MSKAEVEKFLLKQEMLASDLDMDQELDYFLRSMKAGLKTSDAGDHMLMIPTYLSLNENFKSSGDPVIVMDAGGTNFRICLTQFDDNGDIEINHFKHSIMPGSDGEISASEFYNFIADQLEPYFSYSHKIGFCFSYPCEILPSHDGRILNFTKEVQIPEAIDTVVGEEIMKVLEQRGYDTEDIHFVLLNDTVAALLGGFSAGKNKQYSAYAGLILGTGINSAYIEQNENIVKLGDKINPLGSMIINMESGEYKVSHQSPIDKAIDAGTNVPGAQLMEKMISGRYLGLQVLYTIREALETTDLFTSFFKDNFSQLNDLESADLSEFMEMPYGPGVLSQCSANELDRENLFYIIDNILERAAKLVAVIIAGLHIQTGQGKNPVRPLAITLEGSTYYKFRALREKIQFYIQSFINEKLGYFNEFLSIENANIIGSALAALMN